MLTDTDEIHTINTELKGLTVQVFALKRVVGIEFNGLMLADIESLGEYTNELSATVWLNEKQVRQLISRLQSFLLPSAISLLPPCYPGIGKTNVFFAHHHGDQRPWVNWMIKGAKK